MIYKLLKDYGYVHKLDEYRWIDPNSYISFDDVVIHEEPIRIAIMLRHILGLTQTELAKRIGVTFVTINRWENNRVISSKA